MSGSIFNITTEPSDALVVLSTDSEPQSYGNGKNIKVVTGTTVSYTVSKEGYYTEVGSIVVSGNTKLKIELRKATNPSYRFTVNCSFPDGATVNIFNEAGELVGEGTNVAYTTGYEGDYFVYKVFAPGYATARGFVSLFKAVQKEITLEEIEEGNPQQVDFTLKVYPSVSRVIDSMTITRGSPIPSGSTLSNLNVDPSKPAWNKQSGNLKLTFTYSNVYVRDHQGNIIYDYVEVPPGSSNWELVPRTREVWVEASKGELTDNSEITSVYGITYSGTPIIGDIIIVNCPVKTGRLAKPQVLISYPTTVEITNKTLQPGSNLSNLSVNSGASFWTNTVTADNEFLFSREEVVKLNDQGQIVYQSVPIPHEPGTADLGSEIRPVMIQTWLRDTVRVSDADMQNVYGITYSGTPEVGDSFVVGCLKAKSTGYVEVDSNSEYTLSTDYFVYPEVSYKVKLEGYDNLLLKSANNMKLMCLDSSDPSFNTITATAETFSSGETNGKFPVIPQGKRSGKILNEVKLHSIKNSVLLNASSGGRPGESGVYELPAYMLPESYPAKNLHYILIGAGAGSGVHFETVRERHHHGIHHHYEYKEYISGCSGGSGAYIQGCIKNLVLGEGGTNIIVSVGYPGSANKEFSNVVDVGSDTTLRVRDSVIKAGGGKAGYAGKRTTTVEYPKWVLQKVNINRIYKTNWLKKVYGKTVVDNSALPGIGGEIEIINSGLSQLTTMVNTKQYNGCDGDVSYGGGHTRSLSDVYPVEGGPRGAGGGFDVSYGNYDGARPGHNGYAYIVVNDSDTDINAGV